MTETDHSTAFVLAGGGTKGAFEVGVLEHLVHVRRVQPDIVASTSAGSILGVIIGQARGLDELDQAVADLRAALLAMTRTELVFAPQPWLAAFDGTPFGDAINGFVSERTRPPIPDGDADPEPPLPDPTPTHPRFEHLVSAIRQLPAAARAQQVLEGHTGSILTLDPLEAGLRGRADVGIPTVDPSRVQRPGLELRMTVTALQAGETHYVCGDGRIVGPDAQSVVHDGSDIDAIDGALASSSVPMIFEPRPFADDIYVDGGCLQNIPVRAAVHLGADTIYTVVAAPIEVPKSDVDYSQSNFIGVYLRAVSEVGFVQGQKDDLATPLPDGTTMSVIAPTVDVVGPFEVQQGLMLIDMDYGRMRAEEVMADLDAADFAAAVGASDQITTARERAWYLEAACFEASGASAARLDALTGLKREVADGLAARAALGFAAPDGSDTWPHTYETHQTDPPDTMPCSFD